jgi:hypothetical protein
LQKALAWTKVYLDYENGVKEVPINIIHAISSKRNVEMTALITG